MSLKKYIIYFLIAVANTLLFFVAPSYLFIFLPILAIWAAICLVIVCIDIMEKTRLWIGAFYCLGLGLLSLLFGLCMVDLI